MTKPPPRLPEGARQALASLVEGFAGLPEDAPEGEPARQRRLALQRFQAAGFPGRRSEAWRYTDLAAALHGPLPPLAPGQPDADRRQSLDQALAQAAAGLEEATAARIVFIDGSFDPSRSETSRLPQGVNLHAGAAPSPRAAPPAGDMLASLNLALARSGFDLTAADGAECSGLIHLLFISTAQTPCSLHVRSRIRLGANARLRLLESHVGRGKAACLHTQMSECALEAGARLQHVLVGEQAGGDVALARLQAELRQDARLDCAVLSAGGRLNRREHVCSFKAPGAQARISALSLAHSGEQRDITALMDHQTGDCASDTLVKSVLGADGRGVFQGLVRVAEGASGSDGRQVSKALLLGEGASMNAKPELEIFNDDVQCAHGSAIGELDADALFYLRSRGIGAAEARRLLVAAFLADVLARAEDEALAAVLHSRARAWLAAAPHEA